MIARYWGASIPLSELKQHTDFNRLGMSVRDIIDVCGAIGLEAVPAKVTIDEVQRMPLPAILYWEQKHFVVLYKIRGKKRKRYCVADPSLGKIRYKENEFTHYWIPKGSERGISIVLDPMGDFDRRPRGQENVLQKFVGYLRESFLAHRRKFIAVAIITLAIMAADFVLPLLLQRTVDEGIGLRDVGLVMTFLLCQLAVAFGALIGSSGVNLLLERTGLDVNMRMVNHFLEKLSRFPMSFFDRKVSSDFVQKINDQSRIKDFLVSFPSSMLLLLLNLIIFSALLLYFSPLIFGVFVSLSVIEVIWNALFLNRRRTIDLAIFTNSSENRNHAYELANGMADLKVNNGEQARIARWKETQKALNEAYMRSSWLNAAQSGGQTVISRVKDLTVTGIGTIMVIDGGLTMGVLMTLGYITGRLAQPFNTLSSTISSLQQAVLSYQRVDDVMCAKETAQGISKFESATIEFRDVWFKYAGSSSPYVISNLNLKIEPGQTIALVGESGCGKSTLIKLMLGFYVPQKGELRLSNYSVNEIDTSDWLRHCGVVMQDGRIFSGSIIENIAMSDVIPDEKRVSEVIETVGLSDFVDMLPMRLYTRIGVSGIEMSGGQRQRLLIARALYKCPDILFLDEATSSLDANNERAIVDSLRHYSRGRTMIVAAHRLSTVRNADKILVMDRGRIVEEGSHEDLIALRGAYWQLVRNQLPLSV